jgi:hypothetical protein
MIQLTSSEAASLVADHATLPYRVQSAKVYGDVYRYWHAIEFLLERYTPGSPAARWLADGIPVSPGTPELPAARVLSAAQVQTIDAALRPIQPDALAPLYDADALDTAAIYPSTWREWEREFDPLGQVLEHYWFLQQFMAQCSQSAAAALLYFDYLEEGSV